MKSSHSIADLEPRVAALCRAHLEACESEGIDLLITSTFRDWEEQARLYAQGRTTKGAIVTKANAGDSAHNYGLAYDVVPMRNGKPVWGTLDPADKALWRRVGELGEMAGLEWAGRWKSFRELPHFQDLGGKTIHQLKAEHQRRG